MSREDRILGRGIAVVLVGHGAPPSDIPPEKVSEYVRLERMAEGGDEEARIRFERLDREIRSHPRTPENDPYFYGVLGLAEEMRRNPLFIEVIPAFNEFCCPTIEDALESAARLGPSLIVVVPTMMTRGGEHSEEEIPDKIRKASQRLRDIRVVYAWPFDTTMLAEFLSKHIERFIEGDGNNIEVER